MHIKTVESLPGCTVTYTVTVHVCIWIDVSLKHSSWFNFCPIHSQSCPISLCIIITCYKCMRNHNEHDVFCFRVVDVGTEWRTFSNDKSDKDPSRVGASEVSSDHY